MKIPFLDTFTFKSGIKKKNTDLLLVTLPKNSSISGVFTKSVTASASVNYCIKNLENKKKSVRVILVNSGNANAFTGKKGVDAVLKISKYLSKKLKF